MTAEPLIAAVRRVLTPVPRTTMEIAEELGISWRPGSADLKPLRDALYHLHVHGHCHHEPRHNGHWWWR